ncbi:MAG: rhomboid family intramembrane serine protease [Candidatus Electrothrix sp. AR4]|nr:rhomboid family intramembrane serine protease [Candidatus Electrothrix sp. AR4]
MKAMKKQNDIADLARNTPVYHLKNEWVMVAKSDTAQLLDCSLVLSAIGIDHQVDQAAGVILTQRRTSERAMFELRAFREENRNWPPPSDTVRPLVRTDNPPTLLMFGLLILFYTVTGPWFSGNPWFQAGAINSGAILEQGQWWRLITALTLHADQTHLVGNCVIGGFMVHLLCKTTGYGMGWLALILSGMAGNLLNITLRGDPHYSVGFSTAVFAAIGIFCGRQLNNRTSSFIRQLLLPLGTGVSLLAMLGGEGERTDFGAHFFGLGSGLIFGLLLQLKDLDLQGDRRGLQQLLFFLTLVLVMTCWLLATGEDAPDISLR